MRAGDLLRSRREKVGLSLERAAEIARLKPSVLAAIESDETAAIPSVYLRGYIRTYARALGLEPADIEDQLAQVQGAEPAVHPDGPTGFAPVPGAPTRRSVTCTPFR